MTRLSQTGQGPSNWRLAAFAAPALPLASAGVPLGIYLPPFYAQEAGLSLGLVGAIFMLSRIWDAVNDPLIGVLSDRTRSRFGRRKPWIAAGAPVFALAALAIFAPGLFGVKPGAAWLAGWLFVFYLGWTMVQIPLSAWGGELSTQYHQRSRIQTFGHVSAALGLLTVLILPVVLDWIAARAGVEAATGLKTALMGGFVVATLVPAVLLALVFAPEPPVPSTPARRLTLRAAIAQLAGEPLLMKVLASDFAVTLGQSIRGSLFVFFVSAYMGRPDLAAGLFLLQFIFGVFAGPIWLKIGYRLGKHRTVVAGELVQVAINLGLLFVVRGDLALLIALTVAQGLAQGSGNLMLRAIVADVADKQRLETGETRTGLFFSVFSLAGKAGPAVAIGVALPLVAAFGFQPGKPNSPDALEALKWVFALGPALAHAVSAVLIARFPLDEARHREIRAALDRKDQPHSGGALAAAE
ncbi:MAG: MFS transporter [Alphaproteobacteria bacterium]|nr:MFS transporter [Alphaproteobacteria bacterium]MBU1513323.1 MFS transporter [Alphaproteobacteria bacterium]MBU2096315.1 MFS transporter [Alphaproteobacteria bacterium]MBU2154032.1 MFS transporter [Alphaproteobacteria bacterium]MBU2309946.1 MFS transporter [Alphaproteobacteria bacterium]